MRIINVTIPLLKHGIMIEFELNQVSDEAYARALRLGLYILATEANEVHEAKTPEQAEKAARKQLGLLQKRSKTN